MRRQRGEGKGRVRGDYPRFLFRVTPWRVDECRSPHARPPCTTADPARPAASLVNNHRRRPCLRAVRATRGRARPCSDLFPRGARVVAPGIGWASRRDRGGRAPDDRAADWPLLVARPDHARLRQGTHAGTVRSGAGTARGRATVWREVARHRLDRRGDGRPGSAPHLLPASDSFSSVGLHRPCDRFPSGDAGMRRP